MVLEPEVKPNKRAKAIRKPSLADVEDVKAAGSHSPSVVIRHRKIIKIIVLNLPILFGSIPGNERPKKEPTLRTDTI